MIVRRSADAIDCGFSQRVNSSGAEATSQGRDKGADRTSGLRIGASQLCVQRSQYLCSRQTLPNRIRPKGAVLGCRE